MAEKFAAGHAGRILAALVELGDGTLDELARNTGLSSVQVARRLPDLLTWRMAEPTDETRKSNAGREERVWVAKA